MHAHEDKGVTEIMTPGVAWMHALMLKNVEVDRAVLRFTDAPIQGVLGGVKLAYAFYLLCAAL